MSPLDDALIADVRALLSEFASSDVQTFSVELRDDVCLIISRGSTLASAKLIRAPHVATVLSLPAIGSREAIKLDLLGEEVALELDENELVEDLLVEVGDLVEFGTALAQVGAS